MVRERDLAGPRDAAAADQRDVRDRVMRRAERPRRQQTRAGRQRARRPNGSPCTRAPRRRSAAAGCRRAAAPASSCRRPAAPSAAGCARRRPRPRAPAAASSWPRTSARSCRRRRARRRGGTWRRARRRRRAGSAPRRASGSERDRAHVQTVDDAGLGAFVRRQQQPLQMPKPRAATAIGSTPRMPLMPPSSDSSPSTTVSCTACGFSTPVVRQQAERDRQVERRARLAHVGRRQVDRDAVLGETRSRSS